MTDRMTLMGVDIRARQVNVHLIYTANNKPKPEEIMAIAVACRFVEFENIVSTEYDFDAAPYVKLLRALFVWGIDDDEG